MAQKDSFSRKGKSDYPALGFRFKITFSWIGKSESFSFQSISMLNKTNKSVLISNGGDNTHQYKLPTFNQYKDVKLVRGLMKRDTVLNSWFENMGLDPTGRIRTANVVIELRDVNDKNQIKTIEKWTLYNCYPTSVLLGELNAQKGQVLLETVTLAYSKYERNSVSGLFNYY